MRLTDMNPQFVGAGGAGIFRADGTQATPRTGVGLAFDCPCGKCGIRCYVDFTNPLDGGPTLVPDRSHWQRTGDTFETLTLTPSILRNPSKGGCGWHGYIRAGEVILA